MKLTVITILLSLFFMTGREQVHYRLEGTVGDSTLNTRLLLWQTMSDMHVVNQVVDTGIPHLILFAQDGTIIARGLRGEEVENRLSEIFDD